MRTYYVEVRYTVIERFRIKAEYEEDARVMAKSNDFEPYESVKNPSRITIAYPLAQGADDGRA